MKALSNAAGLESLLDHSYEHMGLRGNDKRVPLRVWYMTRQKTRQSFRFIRLSIQHQPKHHLVHKTPETSSGPHNTRDVIWSTQYQRHHLVHKTPAQRHLLVHPTPDTSSGPQNTRHILWSMPIHTHPLSLIK